MHSWAKILVKRVWLAGFPAENGKLHMGVLGIVSSLYQMMPLYWITLFSHFMMNFTLLSENDFLQNYLILFSRSLHSNAKQSQEQKVKCLIHYFERVSLCMPTGCVSFERKVLPFEQCSCDVSYPGADFWRNSTTALCPFEVKLKQTTLTVYEPLEECLAYYSTMYLKKSISSTFPFFSLQFGNAY